MKNINYRELYNTYKNLDKEDIHIFIAGFQAQLEILKLKEEDLEAQESMIYLMAKLAVLSDLEEGHEPSIETLDVEAILEEIRNIPMIKVPEFFMKLAKELDACGEDDIYKIVEVSVYSVLIGQHFIPQL